MQDSRLKREPGETSFGYLLLLLSLGVMAEGQRLQGFEALSAPGIMPLAAGAVMAVSALAIILRNRRMAPADRHFADRIAPRDIALSVAMIALYMLSLEPFGFHLATLVFLAAIILYLRRGGIGFAVSVSLASVVIVHGVFRMVFTVLLPQGWLLRGVLPDGFLQ